MGDSPGMGHLPLGGQQAIQGHHIPHLSAAPNCGGRIKLSTAHALYLPIRHGLEIKNERHKIQSSSVQRLAGEQWGWDWQPQQPLLAEHISYLLAHN